MKIGFTFKRMIKRRLVDKSTLPFPEKFMILKHKSSQQKKINTFLTKLSALMNYLNVVY